MTRLHYGRTLDIELDPDTVRRLTEAIGAHATRGGWITLTGRDKREWTVLITPGIPIWIESDSQPSTSAGAAMG